MIPKRFIRIWLSDEPIPARYRQWWRELKAMHPGWEFVELDDAQARLMLPESLLPLYLDSTTWPQRADIVRYVALYELGGVYVDADVYPIRNFGPLVEGDEPWVCRASPSERAAFEIAVMGGPAGHPAFKVLIDELPDWYWDHRDLSPIYATGPRFLTGLWKDRDDVTILTNGEIDYTRQYRGKRPGNRRGEWEFRMLTSKAYAAHDARGSWQGKWRRSGSSKAI